MSSQGSKPAGAFPRSSKLSAIGSLLAGLAIFIAAGALIRSDLVVEPQSVSLIGLAVSSWFVAAAIIVVALVIIGMNLRRALRLVRPGRKTVSSSVSVDSPENSKATAAQLFGRSRPPADGFESGRLVALKLFEPAPDASSTEMDLIDAVRAAFRESQTTPAASFAMAVANHPDDIVKIYATFIAEHVPVYGCLLPSQTLARVSLGDAAREFAMEDENLVLKDRDGSDTFRNLIIKTGDFSIVLERLRSNALY